MTLYETDMTDTEDSVATKPDLWRPLAGAIGGFDTDPAAGIEDKPIADTVYTPTEDGLSQTWDGKVWLNPPFSDKETWYRKALNELNAGHAELVVALAPVDTSTQWFQRWFSQASVLCWLEGRDWYSTSGSPSFNTVVGVFGDPPNELIDVLHGKGVVTRTQQQHTQETLEP